MSGVWQRSLLAVLARAGVARRLMRRADRRVRAAGRRREAFYDQAWQDAARAVGAKARRLDGSIWEIRRGAQRTSVYLNYTSLDDPVTLYSQPATPFVASFVGDANLFDGECTSNVVTTAIGVIKVRSCPDGPACVLGRPEQLELEPGGDATVLHVEYQGHACIYEVQTSEGSRLRVRAPGFAHFSIGDAVTVRFVDAVTEAWPQRGID